MSDAPDTRKNIRTFADDFARAKEHLGVDNTSHEAEQSKKPTASKPIKVDKEHIDATTPSVLNKKTPKTKHQEVKKQ